MSSKVERTCETCGKIFYTTPSRVKDGYGKFCSPECYHISTRERTSIVCEMCGAVFDVTPSRLRYGRGKFCSTECQYQAQRGKSHPLEGKEKGRQKILAYYQRVPIDERRSSDETKAKESQSHKELWKDPDYRAKMLAGFAKAKLKRSEIFRKMWQDPEFVAKMMALRGKKPTKPEQQLIEIISKHFPDFEYNGDCRLGITLGGLTPDFVNVNGKKQVIEVFGDYWHSSEVIGDNWRRGELGRIMIYNSLGWRCLVIWERDLEEKTEGEIIDIVKDFTGRR